MKKIEKIINENLTITSCFLSFIATTSMQLHALWLNAREGHRILWLAVFVFCAISLNKALKIRNKKHAALSFCLAMVFSVLLVVGEAYHSHDSFGIYLNSVLKIVEFLYYLCGLTIVFYSLLILLFDFVTKTDFTENMPYPPFFGYNRKSFLVTWLAFFLCLLPYFIVLFPGVIGFDANQQMLQMTGLTPFSDNHPAIHTLFVGLCIKAGAIFSVLRHNGIYSFFLFLPFFIASFWKHRKQVAAIILLCFCLTSMYRFSVSFILKATPSAATALAVGKSSEM